MKENEETNKLKADYIALDEQIKLLVKTELKLRRTQAELIKSKEEIEEYSRTLEQKVEERTKELTKSERRFKDIVFSSADWIWEVNEKWAFTYCSDRVEGILGYNRAEILGKTLFDLMPPEEAEKAREAFAQIAQKKEPIKDLESWSLTKTGKRICFLTNCIPILDDHDNLTGYRGVDKDITDRRQAEIKLHEVMQELSRSNHELEQFAYIASHDLQEPLRKIISFGSRLKEKSDHYDAKSADYLDRMQNAATRMQNLIAGLLDYSRVATKLEPFEDVDLNTIVNDVISDIEIRIRETGGKVETETLPVVSADALQMRQLFQNLIGNALKYHKDNVIYG